MLVAINRAAVAAMAVSDPLKPEAAAVVAALRARGVECHMLTGDARRAAEAVARRLALTSVMAEVLPAGKAAAVRELQAAGRAVAMVGDGVNDAPALAAADVGVAVGGGADIAAEAADYVLLRGSLEAVLVALDLSRAVCRRIRANFAWAMGYNVVMIPVAAGERGTRGTRGGEMGRRHGAGREGREEEKEEKGGGLFERRQSRGRRGGSRASPKLDLPPAHPTITTLTGATFKPSQKTTQQNNNKARSTPGRACSCRRGSPAAAWCCRPSRSCSRRWRCAATGRRGCRRRRRRRCASCASWRSAE